MNNEYKPLILIVKNFVGNRAGLKELLSLINDIIDDIPETSEFSVKYTFKLDLKEVS